MIFSLPTYMQTNVCPHLVVRSILYNSNESVVSLEQKSRAFSFFKKKVYLEKSARGSLKSLVLRVKMLPRGQLNISSELGCQWAKSESPRQRGPAFLIISSPSRLCIIIRETKQQWSLTQVVVNGTINSLRGENYIQFESLLS